MDLMDFIKVKTIELKEIYGKVEYASNENAVLSKDSVRTEFSAKETPLIKAGQEINLSEINVVSAIAFEPNGTLLSFYVTPPRKRKPILKEFYFLWD
ncbi:hypothetical protein [Psychrobacillus sp. FSL H8-0510]|uniref:hypothetical protein n=1 Tax=Psychrobacillus sp. FSL H8-0510 TaxID=2921394 RepID=UPI0030FB1ED6